MLRPILELLAPSRCLACRARAAPPWCADCRARVRVLPEGCPRCGAPRGAGHACWPPDAPIDATIAAFDYRDPLPSTVVTAKLAGAWAGWRALAPMLAARVAAAAPDVDVVTWVTTPPDRVRHRGLDHAEVLARAVGAALPAPTLRLLHASVGRRDRDSYDQVGPLPGSNVLLVDDVVTTGATAWRAATVLRAAGAGTVSLAVLARAGSHPLGVAARGRSAR